MDDRIPTPPAAEDALAALRTRIAEAVSRAGVHPVARRTLELLLEAAAEPSPEPPGYRVLDRAGLPRRHPEEDRPLGLDDLIAEARTRHPALFRPPEPEPEPESAPVAEPDAAADIKAATARFVDAQSVRARSLIARSAGQGRAMAAAVARAWTQRRPRPAEPVPPGATATIGPVAASTAGGFGTRLRGIAGDTALRTRGRAVDMAARLRDVTHNRTILRDAVDRRAFALGIGALVLVSVAVVMTGRSGEGDAPVVQTEAQAPGPAAPGNPGAPGQTTNPAPVEEPQRQARPDEIGGPAEVIDTATLRVGGKLVRLFGVEWVRGGQADELTRYLAGRSVTCQPVAGSEARLCSVEGRDLSEVVLFNGGGRASSEATPDLVAAEDHARSERLGVWAR